MLVGTDAAALELRALGAWLAHFDGGEYAKLVSTEGFDIHSYNAKLFGIWNGEGQIEKMQRNLAKSCIFAVCYGAGSRKVGSLFYPKGSEQQMMVKGKEVIDTFYKRLPAIKQLKDKITERINNRGYLVGIDGRHLQIRSAHSALNQLLQSTGAVLMKKASCILHQDLTESGLKYAIDYGFCGHFHDEIQAAVKPEYVNLMMETSIKAIEKSGKYFNLLCPFTGESRTGTNWKETH
jgi:DNA polymerase I-like protein with 3'-5' exonuclease and polymerase domains